MVVTVPEELTDEIREQYPFVDTKVEVDNVNNAINALKNDKVDKVVWSGVTDGENAPKFALIDGTWQAVQSGNTAEQKALTDAVLNNDLCMEYMAKTAEGRQANSEAESLYTLANARDEGAREYFGAQAENGASFSLKKVDRYSREQNNKWGWAVDSGALTREELDRIESLNAANKHGDKSERAVAADGSILIAVGNKHGIDNTVVALGDRTIGNPEIKRVYRIKSEFEDINAIVRDAIYDTEKTYGNETLDIIKACLQEQMVEIYDFENTANYTEYKSRFRNGRNSGQTVRGVEGLQNGSGSLESGGNISEVDSDIRYSFKTITPAITAPTAEQQMLADIASEENDMKMYALALGKQLGQAGKALFDNLRAMSYEAKNPVYIFRRLADQIGTHMYVNVGDNPKQNISFEGYDQWSRSVATNTRNASEIANNLYNIGCKNNLGGICGGRCVLHREKGAFAREAHGGPARGARRGIGPGARGAGARAADAGNRNDDAGRAEFVGLVSAECDVAQAPLRPHF